MRKGRHRQRAEAAHDQRWSQYQLRGSARKVCDLRHIRVLCSVGRKNNCVLMRSTLITLKWDGKVQVSVIEWHLFWIHKDCRKVKTYPKLWDGRVSQEKNWYFYPRTSSEQGKEMHLWGFWSTVIFAEKTRPIWTSPESAIFTITFLNSPKTNPDHVENSLGPLHLISLCLLWESFSCTKTKPKNQFLCRIISQPLLWCHGLVLLIMARLFWNFLRHFLRNREILWITLLRSSSKSCYSITPQFSTPCASEQVQRRQHKSFFF